MLEPALAQLKERLAPSAESARPSRVLRSACAALNAAVGGGLPLGKLIEWGLPPGRQGRELLLHFLAHERPLTLWISPPTALTVYPPAWVAQGIDLRSIYFAQSGALLRELRPAFLEALFDLIIIDMPTRCGRGEQAFFAQQAKKNGTGIFILRPYFLSHAHPNPLAGLRLNASFEHKYKRYAVETLRGFTTDKRSFVDLPGHPLHAPAWELSC